MTCAFLRTSDCSLRCCSFEAIAFPCLEVAGTSKCWPSVRYRSRLPRDPKILPVAQDVQRACIAGAETAAQSETAVQSSRRSTLAPSR